LNGILPDFDGGMAKRNEDLTPEQLALRRAQGRERARRCRARKAGLSAPREDRPPRPVLTPEEQLALRRAQGRERARRCRAREKAAAAASPEARERLRAKWRKIAKKQYAREKEGRERSPEERERFREKWRKIAKKQYAREKEGRERSPEERERFREKWRKRAKNDTARELAGRADDAPESLRSLAKKRREYRRLHKAKKYAEDLHHRLSVVLRSRLRSAVRNGQKRGSAIRDLGCTVADLKAHLERQFLPGMTWENFGHGGGRWSIDHVFPMARADLTNRAHVLAVCNWQNLRPVWFAENVRKSARITPESRALFDGLLAYFRSLEIAPSGRAGRTT
jgi:hypothetical protein